ncbi:MAG: SRPBCC domain-containing protein [Ferruginibacter sp.]
MTSVSCSLQVTNLLGAYFQVMKDYKNYYIIGASPEEVFIALTNPATIQLWSGEKATMSTVAGSEFSLWEGSIEGKNISFETSKKIIQEWYFGEQEEKSVVTILLHPHKNGTSAELRHTNIPEADYDDIVNGWNEVYFGSLINFYED